MKAISIAKSLAQTAVVLVTSLSFCLSGQTQPLPGTGASSYDQLVVKANSLLKESKLDEARQAVQQAIQQDTNRYEGYVVAAKIASLQGHAEEARQFAQNALLLTPQDRKPQVQQLAATLAAATSPAQPDPTTSMSNQDRRKLDVLMLILEDAEKATTPEDRAKAFQEYLQKSADFVLAHPEQTNIWVMRAFAAVEVDEPELGWEAGKKLQALGEDNSNDPKIRRIMASLDRKGWLGEKPATRISQAMLDQYRHDLGVKDDAEWAAILAKIKAVMTARGVAFAARHGAGPPNGGSGSPESDALAALRKAYDDWDTAAVLKDKLAELRDVRRANQAAFANQADYLKAQDELRGVLNAHQEAYLTLAGVLQ